jgi:site-specific recombinase
MSVSPKPKPVVELAAQRSTVEVVWSFFGNKSGAKRDVIDFFAHSLDDFIRATDLRSRLDAFVALKEWVASSGPSPLGRDITRLEALLWLMESEPELRAAFQHGTKQILTEIRSVELFAEAGLHPREGIWSEAVRRIMERIRRRKRSIAW